MANVHPNLQQRRLFRDDTSRMSLVVGCILLIAHGMSPRSTAAFLPRPGYSSQNRAFSTRRFNFFKDMLDKAFENDDNLSKEETLKGQIEGPEIDYQREEIEAQQQQRSKDLTSTQQKWRNLYGTSGAGTDNAAASSSSSSSSTSSSNLLIEGQKYIMEFFLTGVPDKDPSNDLFGSKVNISSRDRQVGLAVPETPTLDKGVEIEFLTDGKCRCLTDSAFTQKLDDNEDPGDWKLSDDGKQIRFRIPVTGYTRTVETRGSIQSVYWSDEEDKVRQTSTSYTIPAGWMYGEAELGMTNMAKQEWTNGILKIEQTTGLLGAGAKMIPCGKFTSKRVVTAPTTTKTEEPASAAQVEGQV